MTSLNRRTKRARRVTLDEGAREDGADHEAEEGAVAVAVASGVAGAEVEAASDSKSGGCARVVLLHARQKTRMVQKGFLQLQYPGRSRGGLVGS
jgi:hypothetical protein